MNTKPKSKFTMIKTKSGRITGYIEVFLCTATQTYVTIPGVSRFIDASQPETVFAE